MAQTVFIQGTVKDAVSHETLTGASIVIVATTKGTVSEINGQYQIRSPKGEQIIRISYLGYHSKEIHINVKNDTTIHIYLDPKAEQLSQVNITDNKALRSVNATTSGLVEIGSKELKELPGLLGEPDLVRSLQKAPGIQSVNEGYSGFYVRGGDPGQNLILLDNIRIFNPSHLLGFFSVFNSDAIQNATLEKGLSSAEYGGVVSSVLDVKLKNTTAGKLKTAGSIGPLSVNGTLEKNFEKFGIIVSGRQTSVSPVQKAAKWAGIGTSSLFKNTSYSFYDINGKIHFNPNHNNTFTLTAYKGVDLYKFDNPNLAFGINMNWGNSLVAANWRHSFSNKHSLLQTFGWTEYSLDMTAGLDNNNFFYYANTESLLYKAKGTLTPKTYLLINYGLELEKSAIVPYHISANVSSFGLNYINKYHFGALCLFTELQYTMQQFKFTFGLRQSNWVQLGPYSKTKEDALNRIIETKAYGNNQIIEHTPLLEPRFNMLYKIDSLSSIKAGLTYSNQYLHLISVGAASFPTDVWLPSIENTKPQQAWQLTSGYHKYLPKHGILLGFEAFYREMDHQLEFKNGLLSNVKENKPYNNLLVGKGTAFGLECNFTQKHPRFTLDIAYTVSRSLKQFDKINNGELFPAKHDRVHDLNLSCKIKISDKLISGISFVFATGNAATVPVGRYMIQRNVANEYLQTNSVRMPPYHRLDCYATYSLPQWGKLSSKLNLSVYNVYNRKNPFTLYYNIEVDLDNKYLAVSPELLSLFPVLPSISWIFNF
jgi:hypothetical protein